VPFPILIGTTLTTVLHYSAVCDSFLDSVFVRLVYYLVNLVA